MEDNKSAFAVKAAPLGLIIIIVLVSIGVYYNALSDGFVYDDSLQVIGNRWITDIKYIPEIFGKNVWGFQDSAVSNYYRPMMHLIYMINFHIFGLEARGFHLVNILFHAGVSVLVFLLILRLLRESHPSAPNSYLLQSFVAAVLFATHPIHTEAVTWVAGLPDVSFTFFYLLSLYFYSSRGCDKPGIKGSCLLSLASFAIAVLCKETALTLPLILVAYDFAFRSKDGQSRSSAMKNYVPYFIVVAVYLILRFHALGDFVPVKRHEELNAYQLLINIFPLFMQYLEKLIFPLNLNGFYVLHPIYSLFEARGILSLIVAIAFAVLTYIAYRKHKGVFFALLFIVVPLLPVLYIPGVGPNTFAERYLYGSSFGFVLMLSFLMDWTKPHRVGVISLFVIAMAITGLYSWETVGRNTIWRDDYTFFRDTVKKSQDGDLPHYNLGTVFISQREYDRAIAEFDRTIELNPRYAPAFNNRGIAYAAEKKYDQAMVDYKQAIELDSGHSSASYNLACLYALRNDRTESCKWLTKSIEMGYKNWESIRRDPDLDNIRNASCYRKIIEGK